MAQYLPSSLYLLSLAPKTTQSPEENPGGPGVGVLGPSRNLTGIRTRKQATPTAELQSLHRSAV